MNPRAREILAYWLGDLDHTPEWFEKRNEQWFWGGEAVDEHIRRHFELDVIRAAEGELTQWRNHPRECLAAIVLLDQFSLNLYREQPRAYRQSELALPLSRHLIAQGWEWVLTPAERLFVYLPFEHSENLRDQEYSVERFSELAASAPQSYRETMESYLDYARRHLVPVRRFGRFPDRNEVFGRQSTADELAFLRENPNGF